jgi:hypothetical protein
MLELRTQEEWKALGRERQWALYDDAFTYSEQKVADGSVDNALREVRY